MNMQKLTDKVLKLFQNREFDAVIKTIDAVSKKNINSDLINLKALSYKSKKNFTKAIKIYEQALKVEKNPMYFGNLGNIYAATGRVNDAIALYRDAIAGAPGEYNFHESLGFTLMDKGDLQEAKSCFEKCVEIDPERESGTYNLGNIYRKMSQWKQAISHLKNCTMKRAQSHVLECFYYLDDRESFESALEGIPERELRTPLAGCVAAHASWRHGKQYRNYFCKAPMEAVGVSHVSETDGLTEQLITDIIKLYDDGTLDDLHQPLLKGGRQSAGNIFLLDFPEINAIKSIIENKVASYRQKLSDRKEGFIDHWPDDNYILYGWLVNMTSGGALSAHIHKEGWVSGSLYLEVPEDTQGKEAAISFSLHGADYPTDSVQFPQKYVNVTKRKICMFPSSLFHKTTEFKSLGRRITLAFDIMPSD